MSSHHAALTDVWSLDGRFAHWIYGPKGDAQGLMLDVSGLPVQFVIAPHEVAALPAPQEGEPLVLEGFFELAAGDNPAGHDVYRFVRLGGGAAAVPAAPAAREPRAYSGRVVRFNFAKHGERNGVILDNGDFIHTKPHGLASLGLKLGDRVTAEGDARPLFSGRGVVVEARRVNGHTLA